MCPVKYERMRRKAWDRLRFIIPLFHFPSHLPTNPPHGAILIWRYKDLYDECVLLKNLLELQQESVYHRLPAQMSRMERVVESVSR